jgi:5'-nucleotidase (lipoprotein e(P4) family)
MRLPLSMLAFLLTACATVPATAPPPAVPPPSAAPCNPGHSLVNATLWMQTSAEYDAAALQTFAAARQALDAALADPSWVGAVEETGNDPAQPPAVVLDLDETALDNSPFETRMIRQGKTYDSKAWDQWTSESAATAVPGAAEFLAYARSRGVTPFYVTNRDLEEEAGTRRNLERLGFPLDPAVDTLLVQGKNGWTTSDKSPRRAHVAASYRLLLLVGDDLNDFAPASGKSREERDAIVRERASWWGTRWFVVPNPMYGSWERAAIGTGGTPCELLQRKVDVLQ